MHGNYGLTLLRITYNRQTDDNFTELTGVPLPTIRELGFVPLLLSLNCSRRFSFQWAAENILNQSLWKNAVLDIQTRYQRIFSPRNMEVMVISHQDLSDNYAIGVNTNEEPCILMKDNDVSTLTLYHATLNGTPTIIVVLGERVFDIRQELSAAIISQKTFTLEQSSTQMQELCLPNGVKLNVGRTSSNLIPGLDINGTRLIFDFVLSKLEIQGTAMVANKYVPAQDNILTRAVLEQWPTSVTRTLIELGANLKQADKNGQYPHHHAAMHNDTQSLKLFLDREPELLNLKDNQDRTALSVAAQAKASSCCLLLIERKADTGVISKSGHSEMEYAVLSNDRRTIEWMFERIPTDKRSSKNPKHPTLFHVAIDNTHHPRLYALVTLLENADNAPKTQLQTYNEEGHTPFHCAIIGSTLNVVNILLPHVDILQVTNYATPDSSQINKSCVELALERLNKEKNNQARVIFDVVFDQFLTKSSTEQFDTMWKKIKPQLPEDLMLSIIAKYREQFSKISELLPQESRLTSSTSPSSNPASETTQPRRRFRFGKTGQSSEKTG